MATVSDQRRLEQEKAQLDAEYAATVKERRRVAQLLNDPNLSAGQRNALSVQYQELDTKATQLDETSIRVQTELNRITNQINQGPNPPVAGPGSEIPPYANQNTGGNAAASTATRYQQAVADDQVRLDQANQGLANTNQQLAAAERERAALTERLRAAEPGSAEYEALFAQRNALGRKQAELETQQSAFQDDIRVRENSLATNKNNLSLVESNLQDRVSAPPPPPTTVTNTTGTPAVTAPSSPIVSGSAGDDIAPADDPVVRGQDTAAAQAATAVPQPQLTGIDPETGLPVTSIEALEQEQLRQLEPAQSPYGEEDDPLDLPADTDTTVDDTEGYIVPDGSINVPPDGQLLREPTALGGNYSAVFDPETQSFGVYDDDTGEFIQTGLTEQEATLAAQEFSVGDPTFAGNADAFGGDPGLTPEQAQQQAVAQAAADEQARQKAALAALRAQASIEAQRKLANEGDWRVKLSLAESADYLYLDPNIQQTGILYPLFETSGVIFPYTPQITTSYAANYSPYDLTHSNLRGYFYQGSQVNEIGLTCDFTAQDTREANYLLAVIHFFRSVTKMFYGQDPNRGQPPPLVFLQGFGEFQFNLHPCVVSQFTYSLPNDVDYIRARSVNINGTDLLQRRDQASLASGAGSASNVRLANSGLSSGAQNSRPAPPTLGTNRPTYVPTKINIELTLLPIQTRQQVSKEFSLREFANGNLVRRGFW